MTPDHDPATLFRAPASFQMPAAGTPAGRPGSSVDAGTEVMQRLRNPFAPRPVPPPAPTADRLPD